MKSSRLLLVFLFLFCLSDSLFAQKKRVLFLSSYNHSFPTVIKQIQGIESVLLHDEVLLDIEYMDTKRVDINYIKKDFYNLLEKKLLKLKPYDVLLVGDDNALRFAVEYQQKLFGNIPIVFFAINNESYAMEVAKQDNITGVIEKADMKETIDIIKKIHVDTNIIAITDNTSTGIGIANSFKKYLDDSIELLSFSNISFDEFSSVLDSYDDSVFLMLSAFLDKNGNRKEFYDSVDFLTKITEKPVYHLYEHGIGQGLIGGKVVMFTKQASLASLMVKDILDGKPISKISYISQSPNEYLFDFDRLEEFDIDASVLPKESIIINQPEKFYDKYYFELLVLLISIVIVAFVVILYFYIRLAKSTKNLKELNANLENIVNEKVGQLRQKDQLLIQQSKLASMGEMMGNIAHQWRQPLNIISLKKDILVDKYYDKQLSDDLVEEFEDDVDNTVQYMSKTIDDFRNFFSPSRQKELFSLKKAIDDSLNIIKASLINNYIKIIVEIEKDCFVNGYKNEFQQVLLNIINNSKDAILSAREKKTIKEGIVRIIVLDKEDEVFIDICDNAGGIPDDIIEKIFEPYFTTKFKSKGTGIGLYMSKMIIENSMHGYIFATNRNEGACFSIKLHKYTENSVCTKE
jgi:signal transduction histidine kinase